MMLDLDKQKHVAFSNGSYSITPYATRHMEVITLHFHCIPEFFYSIPLLYVLILLFIDYLKQLQCHKITFFLFA